LQHPLPPFKPNLMTFSVPTSSPLGVAGIDKNREHLVFGGTALHEDPSNEPDSSAFGMRRVYGNYDGCGA
jgi:hypothetical protein